MLQHLRNGPDCAIQPTRATVQTVIRRHKSTMPKLPESNGNIATDARTQIPPVHRLIDAPEFQPLIAEYGRGAVVDTIRNHLGAIRAVRKSDDSRPAATDVGTLASECADLLSSHFTRRPRGVINATGVIVHTNIGRAPLSEAAIAAAHGTGGYVDLEYDICTGERGSRHDHLQQLIQTVTGAESGIAVNNNAAATLLVLATLAGGGREVIVSRSEAVEIGGGFRIPDVLRQSSAALVEVGTTNRTYASDYADAITEKTAAILKVHRSNFTLSGFTHDATIEELADIGNQSGVPVIHDLGSGALLDTALYGLEHEPMVQESVRAGANVVMFSGDKLLGGPQAGLIAGDADLVRRVQSHPLARALRIDKVTLAALHATLAAYARSSAVDEIPVWRMIGAKPADLKSRAQSWQAICGTGQVAEGRSVIGGGSAPEQSLPTWLLQVESQLSPRDAAAALRRRRTPIVGRVSHDALYLDPRTVLSEAEDRIVAHALREL